MSTLTLEGLIAWTAREAGVELSDPEETDIYALSGFVGGVVDAAGENPTEESVVKALTEALVADPVLFRFLVLRFKETAIIHERPIEGGILDQKLDEADRLIGAIWRFVP